jgi:hypothetical protein
MSLSEKRWHAWPTSCTFAAAKNPDMTCRTGSRLSAYCKRRGSAGLNKPGRVELVEYRRDEKPLVDGR